MPEIRYYVVEQTRRVKVTANDPGEACEIGRAAFKNGVRPGSNDVIMGPPGIWGNTTSPIRIIKLTVEEAEHG